LFTTELRILNAAIAVKNLVLNIISKGTSKTYTKTSMILNLTFALNNLQENQTFSKIEKLCTESKILNVIFVIKKLKRITIFGSILNNA